MKMDPFIFARSVQFIHPVKGEMIQLTAPAPQEVIWEFFREQSFS